MVSVRSTQGKFKAFMLVRDEQGKPKIDDPQNLPAEIFKALSNEDVSHVFGSTELPNHLKNVKRI